MSRKFRVLAVFMTVIIVVCGAVPALSASKKRGRKKSQNTTVNSHYASTLKRVQQGDAQAQYEIGKMYYKGDGVKKDYAEAAKWYYQAAQLGYAKAQSWLGYAYLKGDI